MVIGLVLTSGAFAHWDSTIQPCDNVPPRSAQHPITVRPIIRTRPDAKMLDACGKKQVNSYLWGCAFPANDPYTRNSHWVIYLNAGLSPTERTCVLLYEFSHLPPNLWHDPIVEAYTPDR